MSPSRRWTLIVLWVGMLLPAGASAAEPWQQPFAATAQELVEACDAAGPGDDDPVWYLRLAEEFTYDSDGRRVITTHSIYRIVDAGAAEGWEVVEAGWSPGYQDRPEVRARVVNSATAETWLDPATISEQPVGSNIPDVFSDRIDLVAPLPQVESGSIVEVVRTVRDRDPFFTGGLAARATVPRLVVVHDRSLTYRVNRELPFRWKYLRGEGPDPAREEDGDWIVYAFDFGTVEPADWSDFVSADQVKGTTMIGTSTAESWNAVARAYAAIVDEVLADHEIDPEAGALIEEGGSREEIVARLARHARSSIRYTGLHLGTAGLVPYRPADVSRRGYGDCKDQSTYLVAALRAAGIDAHLATLLTGPDLPVATDLPGLGVFDHAIVHVPGDPEYWIDPTDASGTVFSIPAPVQRRMALIIADDTEELVRIPGSASSENVEREVRTVTVSELGPGTVVERSIPLGSDAASYRQSYRRMGRADYIESLRDYARLHYGGEGEAEVELTGFDDPDAPLEVVLTLDGVDVARTAEKDAIATLPTYPAFSKFDDYGFEEGDEIRFSLPFVEVLDYRVHYPPSYAATNLPEDVFEQYGGLSVRMEFDQVDDSEIHALIEVQADTTAIDADAAAEFMAWYDSDPISDSIELYFEHRGESLLETGRYREAREEFLKERDRRPDAALPLVRLSRLYLDLGLVEAAIDHARAAVKVEPDLALAHRALAVSYSHDSLGRQYAAGFQREAAIESFARAIELDPEDLLARVGHAYVLAMGVDGLLGGEGADLDAAYSQFLELREASGSKDYDQLAVEWLMVGGRYDRLESFLELEDLDPATRAVAAVLDARLNDEGADLERMLNRLRSSTDPQVALAIAAVRLLEAREYEDAAAIWSLFARRADNAGQRRSATDIARTLGHTRRLEDILAGEDEPLMPAYRLMGLLNQSDWQEEQIESLFAGPVPDLEVVRSQTQGLAGLTRSMASQASFGVFSDPRPLVDVAIAFVDWSAKGSDATGWRIGMDSGSGGPAQVGFVVPTRKGYRMGGVSGFDGRGRYALERLDDGREEDARAILEQAYEDLAGVRASGSGGGYAFTLFFAELDAEGGSTLEDCAHALAVGSRESNEYMEDLLDEEPWKSNEAVQAAAWAEILVASYVYGQERWIDRAADRLLELDDRSEALDTLLAGYLVQRGRADVAEALLLEHLDAEPDAHWALRFLGDARASTGRYAESLEAYQRIVDNGDAAPDDLNQFCWMAICGDLETADHAQLMEDARIESPGALHTMALLYACLGEVDLARDYAVRAMDGLDPPEFDSNFLVVAGRIAESLGDAEIARDAYRLAVEHADQEELDNRTSSARLAREWMRREREGQPDRR